MTSALGVLWTGLQSIGWLLYFLCQLISDTLNINYRVVSAAGHLIAVIAKILYMLLSTAGQAVYEFFACVLLTVAGIVSFVINCLYFVVYCCTLLFKVIYFTVTGVADGFLFVLLTPICACQTLHSCIMWIFNTERWMNALAWCLRASASAFSLLGENACWLFLYSIDSITSFYNGFISLHAIITAGVGLVLLQAWDAILSPVAFVYNYILTIQVNYVPVCNMFQLCATSYFCMVPIFLSVIGFLLSVFLILFCRQTPLSRLFARYIWHSEGEVIQIDFDDREDVVDISDDEQANFQRRRRNNVFDYAGGHEEEDSEPEDVEYSSDEMSDETDTDTVLVTDDSDGEMIDVQLPDQSASGHQHRYATRSKGSINRHSPQQHSDQEREPSLCVICQDQVKSVLVLPCRHVCMCIDCARTVVNGSYGQRRICPLCRGNIRIIMNVYT